VYAPAVEELGWRGYGMDSLRSCFSLFTASLYFALLWALWHLPLFFINNYYHK
jgi:membrane protease YdiL (CAAX protease family)